MDRFSLIRNSSDQQSRRPGTPLNDESLFFFSRGKNSIDSMSLAIVHHQPCRSTSHKILIKIKPTDRIQANYECKIVQIFTHG